MQAGQVEILMYNAIGQRVISKTFSIEGNTFATELDLSSLSDGVLTLVIATYSERLVYKVVKK
jgi:uncharacterized membrane protein